MSNAPKTNLSPETGSLGGLWPNQIWVDSEGKQEVRPPRQETYVFGNPEWPIAPWRDFIDETVASNMATVLASGTGNGKSIFGPQLFYESGRYRRIFMTQPRIVATRENARFTQFQMEQATGKNMSHIIGYRTATEGDRLGPSHVIREHTDGYTLQQMISDNSDIINKDDLLIIDEAHERNPNIDIALSLALEKGIRVLIQSASIDTDKFARYCSQALGGAEVPVLEIPGIMHPIRELVGGEIHEEIIKYANMGSNNPLGIDGPLNIGALVPGARERNETHGRIARKIGHYTVLHLHGDQMADVQHRSFEDYPDGKIILMTDVGRQSITVPGLHVMIDGGYHKIGDNRLGVRYLRTRPVSQAGIIQGKGRVGRTMPGIYVHAALPGYPPIPRDVEGQSMVDSHETPPIQRIDLAAYELKLATGKRSLKMMNLMDQPRFDEIEHAVHKLVRLGARVLNSDRITEIGLEMQKLSSLEPTYARMLIEARRYGKTTELQMAAMAAACQSEGITMTEQGCERWRTLSKETRSDMLVQLDVMAQAIWMDKAELAHYHIVDSRLNRAKDLLARLCDDNELDMDSLRVPTHDERKKLIASIVAGCDSLLIANGDNQYTNSDGFEGRLPKSTKINAGGRFVVGTPYALEHYRNKKLKTHRIIKNATTVTAEELEQYAPWRCDYDNEKLVVDRKGKVTMERNVYFDGKPLYQTDHVDVEPSIETTRALLESLFHDENPIDDMNPKTKEIYDEVARLRDLLVHRSDKQDYFEGILAGIEDNVGRWKDVKVKNMYALVNVLYKRQIDTWLRMALPSDSHETKDILDQSPDSVLVDIEGKSIEVNVTYSHNKAFVEIPLQQAKYLEGIENQLGDRHIYVWTDGSKKNYLTLHKAIEKSLAGNRATRRAKK